MAAVEKIEDQRKPEDFFGYRNRIAPYGMGAGDSSINIYLTVVPKENGLPHQCAHWFAMTDWIQQMTVRGSSI